MLLSLFLTSILPKNMRGKRLNWGKDADMLQIEDGNPPHSATQQVDDLPRRNDQIDTVVLRLPRDVVARVWEQYEDHKGLAET